MNHCACGSEKKHENCCGPYISGESLPENAEVCLRSRYTAYTLGEIDFVAKTHHSESPDKFDKNEALEWSRQSEWLGLEIIKESEIDVNGPATELEFKVRYKQNAKIYNHHEKSWFKKEDDMWKFFDGKIILDPIKNENKVGRNDPCPCGSGKKYKKCHGG